MHPILGRYGSRLSFASVIPNCLPNSQRRTITRNSAISRGLRAGLLALRTKRERAKTLRSSRRATPLDASRGPASLGDGEQEPYTPLGFSRKELDSTSSSPTSQAIENATKDKSQRRPERARPTPGSRTRSGPNFPLTIPYTTAASEFLYGQGVVVAALKARRRKLYTLYIRKEAFQFRSALQRVKKLGENAGIKIVELQQEDLPLLDKMSVGGPHNVCKSC